MDSTRWARLLLDPIPAHRWWDLEVVAAVAGASEVAIEAIASQTNVVGALHASGLITLIDAAGLAAIISAAEEWTELEGILPLGTAAQLTFRQPGRGRLTGRCQLDSRAYTGARDVLSSRTDHATFDTTTTVLDRDHAEVCRGTFTWSLRRSTTSSPG